jgi:hypothetical protein
MVDMKKYYSDIDSKKENPSKPTIPALRSEKTWVTDCTCVVCRKRKEDVSRSKPTLQLFADFYRLFPEHAKLEPHKLFLLPHKLWAFVFKTRTWGKKQKHAQNQIVNRWNRTASRQRFPGTNFPARHDRQVGHGCNSHQDSEGASWELYPPEHPRRED